MDIDEVQKKDNELEEQAIKDNLPVEDNSNVESDADLWANDMVSLAENYKQYSQLLKSYVESTSRLLLFKYNKKYGIYNVAIGLFIATPIAMTAIILFCLLLTVFNKRISVLDILPEILTAFGSLVATYIAIVKIVTEYIFNKNEETTMERIISRIQKYDMHIRGSRKEEK